ncbi:DUF4225 domain-containing protein [Vibrio brasiliensis]|uniref:DUF4225 domain-containing protein n=1 Tax=Vibrio brasiliensis TaxID=170652 RepID=UPI001EFEA297|nr:DUF4225 domain-containing protein [Vibrio brasiliensis]MCG9648408.1 DUF4225 domain-containing protein [Vibrio brasiliensis]
MNRVKPHDLWEVQTASKQLNMVASTLMNKHISNGSLKLKFSQSVALQGKCLVQDFEKGKKSKAQVLQELKKEERSLWEQSKEITFKGIGLVAGVMQIAGGGGICYASAGTMCVILGAPLMAHGANNVYENGRYFIDGNANHVGLVRQGYRGAAEKLGYDKSYGDIAYYSVDLGLSVGGLVSRSTTLKPVESWNQLPHAKRFKLFSYSSEDYLRGYQAASRPALLTEAGADVVTLDALHSELNK